MAICTSMHRDLRPVLTGVLRTACDEVLVIGNRGVPFHAPDRLRDSRVRHVEGEPDLANKRNLALRHARGDVVLFIDDDAIPSDGWFDGVMRGFAKEDVGIVTGPSILPADAGLWYRTAQLAMSSTQYSRPRYSFSRRGYVSWWAVIGANVAFRKHAILDQGGCRREFSAQADEMIMAYQVETAGWRIFYEPEAFVYHSPHPPRKQFSQIYKWGRGSVQLKRFGARYPEKDPAFIWYVPLYCLFCVAYALGILKETLFPERPRDEAP